MHATSLYIYTLLDILYIWFSPALIYTYQLILYSFDCFTHELCTPWSGFKRSNFRRFTKKSLIGRQIHLYFTLGAILCSTFSVSQISCHTCIFCYTPNVTSNLGHGGNNISSLRNSLAKGIIILCSWRLQILSMLMERNFYAKVTLRHKSRSRKLIFLSIEVKFDLNFGLKYF